jgi:hypothetical protein
MHNPSNSPNLAVGRMRGICNPDAVTNAKAFDISAGHVSLSLYSGSITLYYRTLEVAKSKAALVEFPETNCEYMRSIFIKITKAERVQ